MTEGGNFLVGGVVTAGTRHVLVPSNLGAGGSFCRMEHLVVPERFALGVITAGAGGRLGAGGGLHVVSGSGNNCLMAPLTDRRRKAGGILGNVSEGIPHGMIAT